MGFALDTQHQAFKFQPFQEKEKKRKKVPLKKIKSCGVVVYVSFLLPL